MMRPAADNPGSWEIRAIILFLRAKNMSAAVIHRELCATYGQKLKELVDNGVEHSKMGEQLNKLER
jgi:hypothetical protein